MTAEELATALLAAAKEVRKITLKRRRACLTVGKWVVTSTQRQRDGGLMVCDLCFDDTTSGDRFKSVTRLKRRLGLAE